MPDDQINNDAPSTPRYRNVSGRPLNRRVVLKAAAGLSAAAMVGLGRGTVAPRPEMRTVSAQEIDGTRAREWIAADHLSPDLEPHGDGWVTFRAEFPFWAVGVGWAAAVGRWPVVELQISEDGTNWGDVWSMATRVVDDGKLPDAGRGNASVNGDKLFTDLMFADGQEHIRYRTLDGEGNIVPQDSIAELLITYIDPTDGPWETDRPQTMARTSLTVANDDTDAPPQIITRAQWGANEDLRYDEYGEIWPPEYQTVEHAIVHHAAVNYGSDGYNAVRSIYYYHCVTQGWGDIGYNYLVDPNGNIFEGRVGGQNVIGGHAFEFAIGSSGICVIGEFRYEDATNAAKAALVTILAFVTRDLDTYAEKQFHEIADLPTICAHRDVNSTSCPGQYLYDDLPEIRDQVAATLDAGELDTEMPAGIVPGDQVKVQTDDGEPLNMRSGGGLRYPVNGSIPDGTLLQILLGPTTDSDGNWYQVDYENTKGWVIAGYLVVTPPSPPPLVEGEIPFGTNIRFTSNTNIRKGAGTNKPTVGTATRNTWAFIMAGPVNVDNYEWYQLRIQGIGDGWAFKNNLDIAPVIEDPEAAFQVGDDVSARRTTPIRVRPGAAQTVASNVTTGTKMKITLAPLETTDAIWYGVQGSFGGGWTVESDLQASAPPPTGDFAIGDTIRVTETLNMRSGAGTGYGVIATLPAGTTGRVVDGPGSANSYIWYRIQTSYGTGWVVSEWLAKTTPPKNTFEIGDSIRITETMNRRSSAGGNVIGQFIAGSTGTVLDGPRSAMGYTWWRMETTSGTGWGAQDWIQKTAAAPPDDDDDETPPPSTGGKFEINDTVRVTEPLNMRTSANTGSSIITTLAPGTTATIAGGPKTSGGYTWWQLKASGRTGWVAQDWLVKTGGSTPPPDDDGDDETPPPSTGGKFEIGQAIRVTEPLNIRSGAGTGNGIVTTLPSGTTGKIIDGPRTGSGYTWWRIETSRGTGWGAEDWLAASSGTPSTGAFASGDTVKVTNGGLRLRASASTSAAVLGVMPLGHRLTITGNSRNNGGYIWWPVRSSTYGSGWTVQEFIGRA